MREDDSDGKGVSVGLDGITIVGDGDNASVVHDDATTRAKVKKAS
jgi:hypothetical protein